MTRPRDKRSRGGWLLLLIGIIGVGAVVLAFGGKNGNGNGPNLSATGTPVIF